MNALMRLTPLLFGHAGGQDHKAQPEQQAKNAKNINTKEFLYFFLSLLTLPPLAHPTTLPSPPTRTHGQEGGGGGGQLAQRCCQWSSRCGQHL